ncbi:tumor necrosis factor receptor superfamily member 1B isoform X2 [Salarias fasciatus]|uniref:tumor necrosis factor receptor superfamily member 1B isoform X2 n=1 Tax=Salarias fasciatus TaxID=181472 RepID=UPI001176A68A|nr:tumor necrosis factor receptor superfamily member 1B-like isoform X2 [Salarias fasciatus]
MKDIFLLLLLVLLSAQPVKVSSQPYHVGPEGRCRDEAKEYKVAGSNLCCKRCPPGRSLKQECSETADSHCAECANLLYIETWNYNGNCFPCAKCKENKGLQYAQTCSSNRNAKCVCQPGMYCITQFDNPYCKECVRYRTCKAGFGVSKPGSSNSDVRCEQCPDGTFSDTESSTDRCRPHTDCRGSPVVRQGDATSDTVCEHHQTTELTSTAVHTTASTTMTTSAVEASSAPAAPSTVRGTTQLFTPLVLKEVRKLSTESPPLTTEPAAKLVAAITGVSGVVVLLVILMLLFLCKRVRRRDSARLQPKVDANGNCQSGDKIGSIHLGESQLTTFTAASPEQQCLLEKGTLPCSERSQSSTSTETSTGTDCHNSHESICASQATLALDPHHLCLSEPMTLLSDSEPGAAQASVCSQSSSQPTSPQIISPITPGPHVNVNITLNIGNGSCLLAGLKPEDCDLPFGEEEECVNTPQQEGGKESLTPVHESDSYCT